MTIFVNAIPCDSLTSVEFDILLKCGASYRIKDSSSPPPERLLMALDAESALLIHWLYKNEWNAKHKLPWMEKKRQQAYELEGNLQRKILKLCCGLDNEEGKRTDRGVGRWGAIFLESRILKLKKVYEPQDKSQIRAKKDIKEFIQKKLNKLGDETKAENPFNQKKQPCFHFLIEEALQKEGVKVATLSPAAIQRLKPLRQNNSRNKTAKFFSSSHT